ncbi:hypothetical protein Fcan01_17567 [Folsomia candida]|uniref:Uncharacterized protein n=1 Tax=Folsomia candida TaxID=158441 RepID=A0A226DRF8_FOLCA|nr:hypothetical protein Fcan01_17567 [Folsomia candida]
MWTTSFRPFLIHHLRVCIFLSCTLCRWDVTSEQIVPRDSTKLGIFYQKCQLISGVVYAIGITLKISRGKDSTAEKCQGTPARLPSILDKVMVAFLRLLETTALLVPIIVVAIQLHNPCALPFLGSLSPYCVNSAWIPPPRLVHVVMLLTDFWMWLHFVYDGSFYIFYAFMTSIVIMLDYLEHFEK